MMSLSVFTKKSSAFIILLCCCGAGLCQSVAAINADDFLSSELMKRRAAYEKIVSVTDSTDRHEAIDFLVVILDADTQNTQFEGTLHLAIKALGVLKAKRAIPYMLPYFTFVPDMYIIEESIPTQWYYPTARAFVAIGEPAIPYLDTIVSSPDRSDEAKRLAAWVIMEVVGKEGAIERLSALEQESASAKLSSGGLLSTYIRDFVVTGHHPHAQSERRDE